MRVEDRVSVREILAMPFDQLRKNEEARESCYCWGDDLMNKSFNRSCELDLHACTVFIHHWLKIDNYKKYMERKYPFKTGKSIRWRKDGVTYGRFNGTDEVAIQLVQEEPDRVKLFDLDEKGKQELLKAAQDYNPEAKKESYSSMLKDDLVKELESRELDTEGKKADLIQRLEEDDASKEEQQ